MKKTVAILAALLLLIALAVGAKLFLIGKPAEADSLIVDIKADSHQINIHLLVADSALAISNLKYEYDETVLTLTPYTVLVSPLHDDGEEFLYYEITDETEIWLGGRMIWKAE